MGLDAFHKGLRLSGDLLRDDEAALRKMMAGQ